MLFAKEEIKNSSEIARIYSEKENNFKAIKEKATKCIKSHEKIEELRSSTKEVFDVVLKNLYTERKPLGVFLLNKSYIGGFTKNSKSWFIGEKNLPKDNTWYYSNLCLNQIGLTLLPSGGQKSFSIIDDIVNTMVYNLMAIQNVDVWAVLKSELKQEKFELLTKLLEGVEILEYKSSFDKKIDLIFKSFSEGDVFNSENEHKKIININLEQGATLSLYIKKEEGRSFSDEIDLVKPSLREAIVLEQIAEEILLALDEYYNLLEDYRPKLEDYVNNLKGKFLKELMLLKITNKAKEK